MRASIGVGLIVTALALAPAARGQEKAAGAAAPTAADIDKAIDLLRADVRAQKADLVAQNMTLTAAEAASFWPAYKKYETERQQVGDERLAMIKDYAANYTSLTDAKARQLVDGWFANDQKLRDLQKRTSDELLKLLPAKTVARFLQVERRLDTIIDLQIAAQIPLVH